MIEATDDAIIAAYIARRERVAAIGEKYKEMLAKETEPLAADMKVLQAEMHRRLLERKAKHSTTDAGVAYFSETTSVKVNDPDAWFGFVADNWDTWGRKCLTKHVAKDNLQLYIDSTKTDENPNGTPPPGLTLQPSIEVNFRKA